MVLEAPRRRLIAVALVGALAGCGSHADLVPKGKLAQLVLQPADLSAAFEQFDGGRQVRLDAPPGPRGSPTRYGREDGWKARYHRAGDATTRGPLVVSSRADLFARAGGAEDDLNAYRGQLATVPGATYSLFAAAGSSAGNAQIFLSYSDDQARSWAPAKAIYGAGAFCVGRPLNACRDSQGSQPTVNPTTGQLWVGFLNGDTPDEDQYLVVTSTDGGNTFSPPSRVDTIYDVNEPRGVNGRADCVNRGQGATRVVLTNTCFRADTIMHSIVADKRGGAFANDLYVVLWDNRNGTIRNSNNDVFFYRSTDGGVTWIGPTRVDDDPSGTPANRDCGRPAGNIVGDATQCPAAGTGADQFFPWVTINRDGQLTVTFHDRRLDRTTAPNGAWPTSRTEDGNYLVWYWGASCRITQTQAVSTPGSVPAADRECAAPEATVLPPATGPVDPGAGPVPGNGQNPSTLPFRNFQVSDVPSNFDYTFRAGVFAGDYSGNITGPINPVGDRNDGDNVAAALWTDARNGRGSGAPTSFEPGRNPICEQSDVFYDSWGAQGRAGGSGGSSVDQSAFLVTPCPGQAQDRRDGHFHD